MQKRVKKKPRKLKLSIKLLEMAMPYYGEFSHGRFRVFAVRESYVDRFNRKRFRIGTERFIVGTGGEGQGLYYSYNRTAVPLLVPESRICNLLNIDKYSDFKDISEKLEEKLEERYTEIIIS